MLAVVAGFWIRDLALPILVAIAPALAILGCGVGFRRLLQKLGAAADDEPRLSSRAADYLIGYPVFGTVCFLVGHLSTNSATQGALTLLAAVAGLLTMVRRKPAIELEQPAPRVAPAPLGWGVVLLSAALAVPAFYSLAIALIPPVTLDEVAYHLAVPRTWALEKSVVELPLISHSYFPLGVESADLFALSILGERGGVSSHVLHLLAAFATAIVIAAWLRRRHSIELSLAATFAIVSTPALLITAGWSWNEWPLVGICAVIVERVDRRASTWPAALLAAMAAGLLCKYTFSIFALVTVLCLLVSRRGEPDRIPWLASAAAALFGSTFFIRNLLLTGNPFAPFFSADSPHVTGFRSGGFGDRLAHYVLEMRFIDEAVGLALPIMILLGMIRFRRIESPVRLLFAGLIAAATALFFLAPSSRILLPFLIGAAMLAFATPGVFRGRRLLGGVLVTFGLLQLLLSLFYLSSLQPSLYLSGKLGKSDFVSMHRRRQENIAWIDQNLPDSSRTLIVGIQETFWFSHPVRGGGNFDGPRIAGYLSEPEPDALSRKLRRDSLTHLALARDGVRVGLPSPDRKLQEKETVLSAEEVRRLADFLSRFAVEEATRGTTTIYRLK